MKTFSQLILPTELSSAKDASSTERKKLIDDPMSEGPNGKKQKLADTDNKKKVGKTVKA